MTKLTRLCRYTDADFVKDHPYIYLSVDGKEMISQSTALFIMDTPLQNWFNEVYARDTSRVYSSNSQRTRTAGLFTLRRAIFP